VGDNSTKQVLQHIDIAAKAGADYALVLPPGYFVKASMPEVIMDFYHEVATKSPLPIIIYNFPGVVNNIDLDSDTIIALAKQNPNIVGVKLSCGKVGKITRLAAALAPEEFSTFAGQADFLIPGLSVGSAGCVTAFGNAFPKTVVKINRLYKAGKHTEALALQRIAGLAEAGTKWGIPSVKYATAVFSAKAAEIENSVAKLKPRSPYRELGEAQKATIRVVMAELAEIEATL
jgi:2-keto-3-deoxy-L-rhamnonate aldolase